MCFRKWGSLVGDCFCEGQIDKLVKKRKFGGNLFLREQEVICRKTDSFGQNYIISSFLHTKTFWINFKVSISSHQFPFSTAPI